MSQTANAFVQTVEQFCAWCEGEPHGLLEARQFLMALMADIPDLEGLQPASESEVDYPRRGHEGWKADHKRFADLPFQTYGVVFDPHDLSNGEPEPVLGDLCDDFADIYGDLWQGLQAHLAGDTPEAFSIWIETYFIHWGQHASSALRAIDIYYRQQVLER